MSRRPTRPGVLAVHPPSGPCSPLRGQLNPNLQRNLVVLRTNRPRATGSPDTPSPRMLYYVRVKTGYRPVHGDEQTGRRSSVACSLHIRLILRRQRHANSSPNLVVHRTNRARATIDIS